MLNNIKHNSFIYIAFISLLLEIEKNLMSVKDDDDDDDDDDENTYSHRFIDIFN